MKPIIVLMLAASAGLWFTGCNKTAEPDNSALEAARKDAAAVSNQLTEASMKLNHYEQMVKVLELEVTNLTQTVHQFSNKVVELRGHLAEQQRQVIAAQTEVPKRDVRIFDLENKVQEQAAQIARLTAQLAEGNSRAPALEKQMAALEEQKNQWQTEAARLKHEREELLRLWDNAEALEARLKTVDPQRLKKTTAKVDKNTKLTLTSQGGVQLSPASALPPAKPQEKKPSAKTPSQKS
jgi:chromosome segregation ATPase